MEREEALQNLKVNPEFPLEELLTLGRVGTGEDLKAVIPYTASKHKEIQLIANGSLSSIIKRILEDTTGDYSEDALQKLGTLLSKADPIAIHEIKHRLKMEGKGSEINTIRLLRYIDPHSKDEFREYVASLLISSDDKVRATAASIAGFFFDGEHRTVFADLLSDPDSRVRANTIEMIEELGDDRLFFLLFRLRNDPHNRVRANAIKALYKIGRTRVKEDLHRMIESPDHFMQASALWVISELEVVDTFLEYHCRRLNVSENTMVAEQAARALATIEKFTFVNSEAL